MRLAKNTSFDIVMIGLSISSSWGNKHATIYRNLARGLNSLGYKVLFLEHDVPWYAQNRDLSYFPYATIKFYPTLEALKKIYTSEIKEAGLVIVGSYVQQGNEVIDWVQKEALNVKAFYDLDTSDTISNLKKRNFPYLRPDQVTRFNIYLSLTSGPTLNILKTEFHTPEPRTLYSSVDDTLFYPEASPILWDLGYLDGWAEVHGKLQRLLVDCALEWPAGKFILAGQQYINMQWPANVERKDHISPAHCRSFYSMQRYTLNIAHNPTSNGFTPSGRLFEAAACGTPVISDTSTGVEGIFKPGKEILIANNKKEMLSYLQDFTEQQRLSLAGAARAKVLQYHTARQRAKELIRYVNNIKRILPSMSKASQADTSGAFSQPDPSGALA